MSKALKCRDNYNSGFTNLIPFLLLRARNFIVSKFTKKIPFFAKIVTLFMSRSNNAFSMTQITFHMQINKHVRYNLNHSKGIRSNISSKFV